MTLRDGSTTRFPEVERLLGALSGGASTRPAGVLDFLAGRVDGTPRPILAELDDLCGRDRPEYDYVEVLIRSRASWTPYGEFRTAEEFVRRLRDRLATLVPPDPVTPADPCGTVRGVEGRPELELEPAVVVEGTLAALKRGELARGLTGLVRMYGVPRLRIADFAAFEARVGELLDEVAPYQVEDWVDGLLDGAQCVRDDVGWSRVRWMRSALELLASTYRDRAAARYVDTVQAALVDDLLRAPTCRFGPPADAAVPRFPNSHWWWLDDPAPAGSPGRAGLPAHRRWQPAEGVWQARLPGYGAGGGGGLSRWLAAGLRALGTRFAPATVRAMVQVLDATGDAVWAAASVPALLDGDRLVPDPRRLRAAPAGLPVVTSATVTGSYGQGGLPATLSVELLRRRGDDGHETTAGGWTVLVVGAEPSASDELALAGALHAWEDALGVPLSDWRSRTRPTLVGRYGWTPETVAAHPPRAYPLRAGVSRQLWRGELEPALVGLARAYGDGAPYGMDAWVPDWVAALAGAGRDALARLLGRLVASTRELDRGRWRRLCAVRSGIQVVADELAGDRRTDLLPVEAVAELDRAMRAYGHGYGPVPGAHVPGSLAKRHPWWRYPVRRDGEGPPPTLDELLAALWAELDRPPRERPTKAPTASLAAVIRAVRRVHDGDASGFTERVLDELRDQLADCWDWGAEPTDRVRRYLRPIEEADWPAVDGGSPYV